MDIDSIIDEPVIVDLDEENLEPLQKYILEDKSKYARASDTINPKTGRKYIDPDNDFLIGESGGFLMNIDFTFVNTELLREVGMTYDKYKKFTFHDPDSYEYEKFREREEYRREFGFTAPCKRLKDGTIVDLHITGQHYNFINYGHIHKLDRGSISNIYAEPNKIWGIPENFDSQYWIFKVKQFAIRNSYNLIILKSRRKGMSFIEGVGSANVVNLYPGVVVIHAAYDKKYLTKAGALTSMSKTQLDFYESKTPFIRGSLDEYGVSRGLLKKDIEELKTGYKDSNRNDSGDLSTLFTVSTMNNTDVAVGKGPKEIKCDELNTFPNFTDFMKMTNPATTTGAFKTGIVTAFGTGGTKEGNWAEFEKHYLNPIIYDFMPFENVWDENGRDEITGMFLPYWWGLEGVDDEGIWSMDKDGNSDYKVAIKISKLERKNKLAAVGNGADYINFCSQYSNRPGEAFNSGTTKVLSSPELKLHIKDVKTKKEYRTYKDGWVVEKSDGTVIFKTNAQLIADEMEYHPYIEDVPFKSNTDLHGCIRMFHNPYRDPMTGLIPDNLNFVVYDPYAADIEDGEVTTKHSLAAVQVWMYPNNVSYSAGKILLASWVGRLDSTEKADMVAILMAKLYNANILPEIDRGTMISTAKKFKFLHRILPDPTVVTGKGEDSGKRTYGMKLGNTSRKLDGIVMLRDLIYEQVSVNLSDTPIRRFHLIEDLPTLLEYDKFSYKGNFDRVSCNILVAYQINAYITLKMKPKTRGDKKRLYDVLKKKMR